MTENISWKQKIKKLQIIFFVLVIVAYYVYNYAHDTYIKYENTKKQLTELKVNKITSKEEELLKLKEKISVIDKIKKNYKPFVISYNKCYPDYISKKYGVENIKITSLRECIDKEMLNRLGIKYDHFIKTLKDVDIEKIVIWLWITKNELAKFDIDQKRFLRSLDQHVFDDSLEKYVSVLTIWEPVLLDKKLGLYKVSFSFPVVVDYETLLSILKKMQNNIADRDYNNLYYTISTVSNFDISNTAFPQKINIQWNFYFTK